MEGRLTLVGRLTLRRYNLADSRPGRAVDRRAICGRRCASCSRCCTSPTPSGLPRAEPVTAFAAGPDSDPDTTRDLAPCDLKDKKALITGGSRGIGRALRRQDGGRRRHGGLRLSEQPRGGREPRRPK